MAALCGIARHQQLGIGFRDQAAKVLELLLVALGDIVPGGRQPRGSFGADLGALFCGRLQALAALGSAPPRFSTLEPPVRARPAW